MSRIEAAKFSWMFGEYAVLKTEKPLIRLANSLQNIEGFHKFLC
jgi:hypothetical protein